MRWENMVKVAILYICTGKYDVFWKDFFESYEQYFLPNSQKEYFVFTDSETLYSEDICNRIHKIYQKQLGWPDDTLMRFHMFDSISEKLEKFDYIFFMNANCKCVTTITEEEFLPKDKDILVVQHPGAYKKRPNKFTYDRNPKSTAYIPKGQGQYYICGGINGGKSEAYLNLIKELKKNIDIDKANGVIAKWHDESHINRYILNHDNWMILSPSYCFAEGWNLPFEPKILVREKSNYFDSVEIKSGKLVSLKRKVCKYILNLMKG
jgi:hypothetical protein